MPKKVPNRKKRPKTARIAPPRETLDWIEEWIGSEVVVDVRSPFVYLGVLRGCRGEYLLLEDADAHDLRDGSASRELYIVESREHGIHRNRKRVLVRLDEVVGISKLDDVLME